MRLPRVENLLAREDACTLRSVVTRRCSVCSHAPLSRFGRFRECSITLRAQPIRTAVLQRNARHSLVAVLAAAAPQLYAYIAPARTRICQ